MADPMSTRRGWKVRLTAIEEYHLRNMLERNVNAPGTKIIGIIPRLDHVTLSNQHALVKAVENNNLSAAAEILDSGVDPNLTTQLGRSLLSESVSFSADLSKLLLSHGALPNGIPGEKFTPLYYAILTGDAGRVTALFNAGADLGICDTGMNANALHVACRLIEPHCTSQIFDYLLEHSSCNLINQFDKLGRTPLMESVRSGNQRAVNSLVPLVGDINACQPNGSLENALHMLALHPNLSIGASLIKSGANRSAKNVYGARPIDLYLSEFPEASRYDEIGLMLMPRE